VSPPSLSLSFCSVSVDVLVDLMDSLDTLLGLSLLALDGLRAAPPFRSSGRNSVSLSSLGMYSPCRRPSSDDRRLMLLVLLRSNDRFSSAVSGVLPLWWERITTPFVPSVSELALRATDSSYDLERLMLPLDTSSFSACKAPSGQD
jgi:hypothetical protein